MMRTYISFAALWYPSPQLKLGCCLLTLQPFTMAVIGADIKSKKGADGRLSFVSPYLSLKEIKATVQIMMNAYRKS